MEFFIVDKSDKILSDYNRHAVNTLIMAESGNCIAMKDEVSGQIAGYCFVTVEAKNKDTLIIDSIEIDEQFWKAEAEIFFIDEVSKMASEWGYNTLLIKCDVSNVKSLRAKDAANLAGFDFAYEKKYYEYSLEDLLKSRLVKNVINRPEDYPEVLFIQDKSADLFDTLEQDCKKSSVLFSIEDYDTDLTLFYPGDEKIEGVCMAKPHSEGVVYIDGAYIGVNTAKDLVYKSMLAACIMQLSEYFMSNIKVRIRFENDDYRNKIMPFLGEEFLTVNEEYYVKRIG